MLKTHRFISGLDMRQTLERYVYLYIHQLLQSALNSRTPFDAAKQRYEEKPELFHGKPEEGNRPGCDNYEALI